MAAKAAIFAALTAVAVAGPVFRSVDALDQAAFAQAQQRDDTATRAYSDTSIKTSDGRCLFVDQLSGDASANITPIQVADCGSTTGQGWDVITQGKHLNVAGSMLIVNTLTQACATYDAARDAAGQVMLFSCGGAADGTGNYTTSQIFAGDGSAGTMTLTPGNGAGSCFTVKGNAVQMATCTNGTDQTFTFSGSTTADDASSESPAATSTQASGVPAASKAASSAATSGEQLITVTCDPVTVTERITVTESGAAAGDKTTTVFVTLGPSSSANMNVGVTTTVLQTVTASSSPAQSSAASSAASSSSAAAPTTAAPATSAATTAAPVSATGAGNTATIPRISINPHTTVTLT